MLRANVIMSTEVCKNLSDIGLIYVKLSWSLGDTLIFHLLSHLFRLLLLFGFDFYCILVLLAGTVLSNPGRSSHRLTWGARGLYSAFGVGLPWTGLMQRLWFQYFQTIRGPP